jgi:hypothetical protein
MLRRQLLLKDRDMRKVASAVAALAFVLPALAQEPRIRDIPPRPIPEAEDPVNRFVAANTIEGLVLSVTIDGTAVTLDQATPARIRKTQRMQPDREGDLAPVTAVGYAGGARISEARAPDSVLRALDDWNGRGRLVRVTRRQVLIALPAPRALDTVEIIAPATGARARLDVRAAYARWCRQDVRDNPMCPDQKGGPTG